MVSSLGIKPIYGYIRNFARKVRDRISSYLKARYITLSLFGLEKGFKNIDELVNAIVFINRAIKARIITPYCKYFLPASDEDEIGNLYQLKTELIKELLKKYRDEVKVGYLIGGTDELSMPYDFSGFDDDPCKMLEEKYGDELIKCSPVLSSNLVTYHVLNWNKVNAIASLLLRNDISNGVDLCDLYGLIEVMYNGHRMHVISSAISYLAKYIRKFDYIALRWQHYKFYQPSRGEDKLELTTHNMVILLYYTYKARYLSIANKIYWRMTYSAITCPTCTLLGQALRKLGYL